MAANASSQPLLIAEKKAEETNAKIEKVKIQDIPIHTIIYPNNVCFLYVFTI